MRNNHAGWKLGRSEGRGDWHGKPHAMRGMRGDGEHGHREGRGGGRGGGTGRGGGRLFEHGAIRWVLLSLIAQKPSHGYELIKAIETRMAGVYAPSPGVIYPSLSLLEDMGAVEVTSDVGKKLYAITDEGRGLLADNVEVLVRVEAKMDSLKGRSGRPAEIQEAIESFRATVRQRVGSEEALDPDTVAKIAAIIRQAAKEIGQL